MTRRITGSIFLLIASLALAHQVRADDLVIYLKKAAKTEVSGKIEKEGPEGIRIKSGKMSVDIPALDIVQVVYEQKKLTVANFRPPFSALEKALLAPKADAKELPNIRRDLERLAPQFQDVPTIDRHIQYSICQAALLQGRDDAVRRTEALKLLDTFRAAHKEGWQILPALKSLAELQQEKSDAEGALKTFEQLMAIPGTPADVKTQAELQIGRLQMLLGRSADAEKRWLSLLGPKGLPTDSVERWISQAYLQRCRLALNKPDGVDAELRAALKGPDDPKLRAIVYNTLADSARRKGDKEEAFWNYMRVEVVYPQDAEEEAHSLYYLAGLFEEVKKDAAQGKECLDKLRREDRFKGTEYRLRADAEKK